MRKICVAFAKRILSPPCGDSASRCNGFVLHSFCTETRRVLLLVCCAGTAGRFVISRLCQRFLQAVQEDVLPLSLSLFSTAVEQSRVLEHATAMSVDSVVDQEESWTEKASLLDFST